MQLLMGHWVVLHYWCSLLAVAIYMDMKDIFALISRVIIHYILLEILAKSLFFFLVQSLAP